MSSEPDVVMKIQGQQLIDDIDTDLDKLNGEYRKRKEFIIEMRRRMIKVFEPERLCPNCGCIAERGDIIGPCPDLVDDVDD